MSFPLDESTREKVPPLLEDLLKRTCNDKIVSESKQTDIFLNLIIVMLSENGFSLMANDKKDLQSLQDIDSKHLKRWRNSSGVYELTFVMNGFHNTSIRLALCALGGSCLINVIVNDIKTEVYSVCYPVGRYIVAPEASPVPMMFCDLKHLCDTFKNKIITPVKSAIMNFYGYSGASLIGLPEELIFYLMMYLPVSDIINVAKTCKKLSLLLNNDRFWHRLFLRDFSSSVSTDCQDWKTLYRNVYTMHQESLHKARRYRGTLHDLMDISEYFSHIENPMWDIVM